MASLFYYSYAKMYEKCDLIVSVIFVFNERNRSAGLNVLKYSYKVL